MSPLEVARRAPEGVLELALVSASAQAGSPEVLAAQRRQSQVVDGRASVKRVDAALFRQSPPKHNEADSELARAPQPREPGSH